MEEVVRKAIFAVAALLGLSVIAFHLAAQESPKTESKKSVTVLKVQVTFSENEGEKKVANLPYTFFLRAAVDPNSASNPWTKVRVGSRVPVYVGKDGGMQYIDVGTNIDARAFAADDGRFDLYLNLERSWVEGEVLLPSEKSPSAAGESNSGHFKEPIIRQFKAELTFAMRDGQTMQTTQAADPLSGRVFTISVTMNVAK
jgi:hypothetical protein